MEKDSNKADRLFVFLEVFAGEGGIQSYVKNIFEACLSLIPADRAFKNEIFLLRDRRGCDNPYDTSLIRFNYFKTVPAWIGRLKLASSLLVCLIQRRPQQVICGHIKLARLINIFCQSLNIPYLVSTHGKEVWETLPTPQQKALQQAARIWTVSRYSRDRLIKANNIDPNKVDLLPCTIDGKIFTPGPKSSQLLEKYTLKNAKVLMTVARLWSGDIYKGVDVTIRALPKIIQTFPDVKYLVIGRGDDRPRLEGLAKDLGIEDRVVFAGFIPTEELPQHYRLADAYIMPSQEGFGIVYLEAMACGIPVLSGDDDGSADPLQDGLLGWRVPHRDRDAVAAACIEILQGDDRRCNGEWLRELTLAKFGKEAFTRRLQDLLF